MIIYVTGANALPLTDTVAALRLLSLVKSSTATQCQFSLFPYEHVMFMYYFLFIVFLSLLATCRDSAGRKLTRTIFVLSWPKIISELVQNFRLPFFFLFY